MPQWHRELYTQRYLHGDFRPEVLQREAVALAEGNAHVQLAIRAVDAREKVLSELLKLRTAHSDATFERPGAPCRQRLSELLLALRTASVEAIEALAAWRHFVASPAGDRPLPENASRAEEPMVPP